MIDVLFFVCMLVVFAWIARAVLGARELTWIRTLLASVLGLIAGIASAALILVRDFENPQALDREEVVALTVPLAIVWTMVALVGLEVLFASRARKGKPPRSWHPFRSIRRWFGMWMRGIQVTRILARHGLGPLVGLRSGEGRPTDPRTMARQTRLALEEAGGMFVKLGQLLVTRPDLLPPEAVDELSSLRAEAAPLPPDAVRSVIEAETGKALEDTFASFDWDPLGSASIGQVHAGVLVDGREVVVKVRRPGLEAQVDRDLAIVAWLARTAERRTTWGKTFGVVSVMEGFAVDLRRELDFGIEAANTREVAAATAGNRLISVPEVVTELSTSAILVMQRMHGTELSRADLGPLGHERRRALADALCSSQVKAMLRGQRFHGDPHQGNVMLLEDGTLGLLDFGIAERLDSFQRSAVLEMLVGLKLENPVVLYDGLMTLGAVGASQDRDRTERALAQFMASHDLQGQPDPEALTDLLRLTAALGMQMPSSTTTMFRALATLSGTLETLDPGYPLLEAVGEVGGAELRDRATPTSMGDFVQQEWAELGPIFRRAPHHLDRIATKLEQGGLTARLRLFTYPDEVRTLERLVNRIVLVLLSIGMGAGSVLLLGTDTGVEIGGTDLQMSELLGWLGITFALILALRVLLEVIRSTPVGPE